MMTIEKTLLKTSVETLQQSLAIVQNLIHQIKIVNERLNHLEDQLEGTHPSDRFENSIDTDIDSTEVPASSSVVNPTLVATESSDDFLEHIPESDGLCSLQVVPSVNVVSKVPLTTVNNCVRTKDTRKQHACANRFAVLQLFTSNATAPSTGYGAQYKIWKPGLCA